MSRIKAAIVAAAIGIAALVIPTAPAQAYDDGNGNAKCDTYEICFNFLDSSIWNTEWGIGHSFYWGSMAHNTYVMCDPTGWQECIGLMDEANGFWNRDSTCDVKLWDVDGYGTWFVYGDYGRGFRGNVGGRRNNGHSRC
jgi:hypothetical protein